MSFFDDSPELAADLRDVFNILYPPSPTSTKQDDWEESDEGGLNQTDTGVEGAATVDLDGPVSQLPPLDIQERPGQAIDPEATSRAQASGYVETLMGKLSRKRIRAILDSTLPLIGRAPVGQEKVAKKRKLIEVLQPGIQVPDHQQYRNLFIPAQRFPAQTSTPMGMVAKRNRQRSSETTLPYISAHPAYTPFSALSYLSRLRTFSLKTYPLKPQPLSPPACAQAGWVNEGGRDRLFCRVCQKAWRVEMPGDAVGGIRLSAHMKQKYIQLLAEQIISAHASSCPWRVRQCPATIHRDLLLLNPPISSHLASAALEIEAHVLAKGETPSIAHFEEADFELHSPLKTTEVDCLTKNLNEAAEVQDTREEPIEFVSSTIARPEHARKSHAISSTAATLAFFGWNVFRPGSYDPVEGQLRQDHKAGGVRVVPEVLRCKICDRKIGLWAFRQTRRSDGGAVSPAKALNVVREHREFCPVRTLSSQPDDNGENHKAWWTDAAILHSVPIHPSQDSERTDDEVGQGHDIGVVEVVTAGNGASHDRRHDLESVVAALKMFIS